MMQPMRITARLLDGRVAGTEPWFPLDSILGSAWMHLEYPELCYQPIQGDLIEPELPFERRGDGNDWYWACSFNQSPALREYITHWHKRVDDGLEKYVDFGAKRGKIDNKSGRYKAYRMPMVVQIFDSLEWYAVGDIDEVKKLCRKITHIGKKPSQGYGAVDFWEVEPFDHDWSVVGDGGKLMRAIPAGDRLPEGITGGQLATRGIRPPYWHIDNQRKVWMP